MMLEETAVVKSGGPAAGDGGFVFVRVLGQKPDGKVLVSFAGNVFEADSKIAGGLKQGAAFKAQLKIANGNVNLIPVKAETSEAFMVISVLPASAE